MALPRQKPLRWPPTGLSDALDGSDAFHGAMSMLGNLIPERNSKSIMVARPAAVRVASPPDYAGGPITALLAIGNLCYGMYASVTFAGKDRPFVYDLVNNDFMTISGLTSGNLPTSQPTTGDWTPPTIAQVASRVLFTHPGFTDGGSNPPYWNTAFANTYSGSEVVDGIYPPIFGFLQPGMQVFGTGIPTNTTITAVSSPTVYTTATGTNSTPTLVVANATGIVIGQSITGPGIPSPTTVTNVVGTTITLSNNLSVDLTSAPVTFAGSIITLSQNATASNYQTQIHFTSSMAVKFGWLDFSGASILTQGNTISGVNVITGFPTITGVQPGMTINGTGIPAGTVVNQVNNVSMQVTAVTTSGSGHVAIETTPGSASIGVGMQVVGAGIPQGAVIAVVDTPYAFEMNVAATSSATETITVTGSIIIISKNATANGSSISITIAGGSAVAPLWSAGDTNIIPLAGVPVFVSLFTGRAYFGVNTKGPPTSGVTASDSGIPCQVSNTNQILLFDDGIPVMAAAGLGLSNQLGGIIQSLMVFQGDANIQQITGDFASGNINVNPLQTSTGTLAPNSIAKTTKGLMFVASDGLRLIDFNAAVSDPIGGDGKGLILPFVNAVTPSRMAASFNEDVYRVTVTWVPPARESQVWGAVQRTDEFWFQVARGMWTGPHTSTMNQVSAWQAANSFICAPTWGMGALYRSDPVAQASSVYVENSVQLNWHYGTVLTPDNPEQMAICIIESSMFFSMPADQQALVTALDDDGNIIGQAYIWLGPLVSAAQRIVAWNKPLIFRQLRVTITGQSSAALALGALDLRYQVLNYQLTREVLAEFILGQSVLGGPDVLGP